MVTMEDVFSWLDKFSPRVYSHRELLDSPVVTSAWSGLTATTSEMKDRILQLIDSKNTLSVRRILPNFEQVGGRGLSSYERGETYAWCGWFYHLLGEDKLSTEAFKRAAAEYPAASHQRAISYLLLAFSQLQDYRTRLLRGELPEPSDAILHFEKSIRELKALEIQTHQDHLNDHSAWYKITILHLETSLAELINTLP